MQRWTTRIESLHILGDQIVDVPHPEGEWVKTEDAEKLKEENKLLREREGRLIAALDKLARLGNGTKFGNSIGNTIALDALRAEFPETYKL